MEYFGANLHFVETKNNANNYWTEIVYYAFNHHINLVSVLSIPIASFSEERNILAKYGKHCIKLMQCGKYFAFSVNERYCIIPKGNNMIGVLTFGWMIMMVVWTNGCRKLSSFRKYYTSVIVFYGAMKNTLIWMINYSNDWNC